MLLFLNSGGLSIGLKNINTFLILILSIFILFYIIFKILIKFLLLSATLKKLLLFNFFVIKYKFGVSFNFFKILIWQLLELF